MAKYICEISASGWFYYKYICHDARSHVTMHGHTNVNYCDISQFAISNETCSVQWRSAAWPKPQNNSTVDKDSCDADEVHWYRVGEQTDRDPTFGQNSPSSQRSILTAAHPHISPSSQQPILTAVHPHSSPSSQRSILTAAHPHSGPSSQRPILTAAHPHSGPSPQPVPQLTQISVILLWS